MLKQLHARTSLSCLEWYVVPLHTLRIWSGQARRGAGIVPASPARKALRTT